MASGHERKPVENKINTIGGYTLGPVLGRGGTGIVRLATDSTGKQVALKIVSKRLLNAIVSRAQGLDPWVAIKREIEIMKMLNHPNIIALYGTFETSKNIYMVTEYVRGGELFDYIPCGGINRGEALRIFKQIVTALLYCHGAGVVHRDLKPENILLDGDKNVKLCDFGLASRITPGQLMNTSCGSPHYVSPEVTQADYDGKKADVWSLGVVLYAMSTGQLPFNNGNVAALLKSIRTGKYTIPKSVDEDISDLISKMLKVDFEERVGLDEVLSHPALNPKPKESINKKAPSISSQPPKVVTSLNSYPLYLPTRENSQSLRSPSSPLDRTESAPLDGIKRDDTFFPSEYSDLDQYLTTSSTSSSSSAGTTSTSSSEKMIPSDSSRLIVAQRPFSPLSPVSPVSPTFERKKETKEDTKDTKTMPKTKTAISSVTTTSASSASSASSATSNDDDDYSSEEDEDDVDDIPVHLDDTIIHDLHLLNLQQGYGLGSEDEIRKELQKPSSRSPARALYNLLQTQKTHRKQQLQQLLTMSVSLSSKTVKYPSVPNFSPPGSGSVNYSISPTSSDTKRSLFDSTTASNSSSSSHTSSSHSTSSLDSASDSTSSASFSPITILPSKENKFGNTKLPAHDSSFSAFAPSSFSALPKNIFSPPRLDGSPDSNENLILLPSSHTSDHTIDSTIPPVYYSILPSTTAS